MNRQKSLSAYIGRLTDFTHKNSALTSSSAHEELRKRMVRRPC